MSEPFVHKIFTGKVKKIDGDPHAKNPMERPWKSSLFKKETEEQIWLGKNGLVGDEIVDLNSIERVEKAVSAYPIKHYAFWEAFLKLESIKLGQMGENFSVLEMDEFSVCIGDIYQLGDAIIQVSQPKQPAWQLSRRFQKLDLALHMQENGRTGWYFRVLQEGNILSRIDLELLERPYPEWSIAACNEVMYVYRDDLRLADDLVSCDLLSKEWKNILQRRLRGQPVTEDRRLFGPNKD